MSDSQFESELDRLMSKKKKFISWVVSDCHITAGASKRKTIVKNLKNIGDVLFFSVVIFCTIADYT